MLGTPGTTPGRLPDGLASETPREREDRRSQRRAYTGDEVCRKPHLAPKAVANCRSSAESKLGAQT